MANVVEYTLSLNDWITGKLNKINITNNRALEVWAKVEQRVNSASNTMQNAVSRWAVSASVSMRYVPSASGFQPATSTPYVVPTSRSRPSNDRSASSNG